MMNGYYEIILELNCISDKNNYQVYSNILPISKTSKSNNLLDLQVLEFYDTPSEEILNLDNEEWLRAKKNYAGRMKFLGPTFLDHEYKSNTWKIHTMKIKKDKDGYISKGNARSRTLMDTKIPVNENIYTAIDIMNRHIPKRYN